MFLAISNQKITKFRIPTKKTIALFEHAASASPDPQIKAFAVKTLPILKHHYMEIQKVGDKLQIAYDK
ncbi:DUF4142 domain-containing protein [Mucilaginibacter sp.]|uniref:DUF4142 domain-containing protein n=1 Tax=Mucilaginibacter sp. TaxID=1882438 RepID=UPI0035BBAEE1